MKQRYKETFRITTTRPVAILMIVVAVFVFGVISYYRLSLNLMPEITYPSITVRTEYPGTAPEEIETVISRPIEQALGIVNHLVNISSISKAGFSDVILEFTWDTDMNLATQDVREKLDQVFLPQDVKRPMILRYDPTLDPIMRFGLYGDLDLFTLRRIADEDVRRELETIPGVAAVKVKGGLEEEIRVEISEDQLTVLNISIAEINQRLAQENINLAGGNLKEGDTEYLVRTLNEFRTLDEIRDLIIWSRSGADIRIKDIGKIFKTNKDREVITRVNAVESVDIEIYKEADANIVTVAELVKARIFGSPVQRQFVKQLQSGNVPDVDMETEQNMTDFLAYSHLEPEGIHIQSLTDRSLFIKSSIDEVRNTAIMGGMLAIIVLYLFLRNILSTFIIGLAIPVSVIATFAPMYIFNVSLNIMSLGGLALGIGMLVDNSIVVLESIFRCREEGDSITEAAIRGTGEVGSAVTASTLTTIAVFFPIVFVEGIAGQIFGDMSLVVVFSLLASLLAALFFIPMLASRQMPTGETGSAARHLQTVEFLRFRSYENIRQKLKSLREDASFVHVVSLFGSLPANLILTLLELLKKILQSVVTLFLVIGEFTIIIFKGLLYLFGGPFTGYKNLQENVPQSVPGKQHTLPDVWGELFWNNLMQFSAYNSMKILYVKYFAWIKNRPTFFTKAIAWFSFLFTFIYMLVRFVLEAAFSLISKLLIILLITTLALLISLVLFIVLPSLFIFIPAIGIFNRAYSLISSAYPVIISEALKHKGKVIISAAALFAACIIYLLPGLGMELIPELHQGEFTIELTYPVGTPLEQTAENISHIENMARSVPEVTRVSTVIGVERKSTTSTSEEGEHTARITASLDEGGNLIARENRAMTDIRGQLQKYSGITAKLSRPVLFSFKTPVEVEIQGNNLETLQSLSDEVVSRLSTIEGLTDVKSNIRRGSPEVQIKYDRTKLAKNNLNIYQVASLVKNKIKGEVATEFKDRERKIDILVRIREEDKASLEDLYRLVINPGSPKPIPLSAVATIAINEGPSEIRRINQQRTALVTANITGIDLGSISERIDKTLQEIQKPDDFSFAITGQNKEMQTSMSSLRFALILAIFLVYVVMASQFESLLHPFVILFTIPLAIIGVVATLYVLNISISVVVFIGMIMLAGIVVNNAIVFVDYINQLRQRGMQKVEAIILAGKVRLRPILMTTTTTVLALLPMALGFGEGAEIRTPMAVTVIAGLISATVLTLVVIPTVYALVDRKQ